MSSKPFDFWSQIKSQSSFSLGWEKELEPRPETLFDLPDEVPEILKNHLHNQGLTKLYKQQVDSFNCATEKENFLVVTPTASGKSLCFWLPILSSLLSEPRNCFLVLFPTKALAANQFRKLLHIISNQPELISCVKPYLYNGDISSKNKAEARKRANILFTNPDSLHASILPQNGRWSRFFMHMQGVVVDEAHVYGGVFGSHVCLLFSRLRRICHKYGSNPHWMLASATLGNEGEHGKNLIGKDPQIFSEDSSPKPPGLWASLETEHIYRMGGKSSELYQRLAHLCEELCSQDKKILMFTQSRLHCELMGRLLKGSSQIAEEHILVYRSGLSNKDRKKLDEDIYENNFKVIVGTSALEMGVDIGQMDVVVILGFPPSLASFRQQAGRTGRGKKPGLVLYVPLYRPLDSYIAKNSHLLFQNNFENISCDPQNNLLLEAHIKCAAQECPLNQEDSLYFGEKFESIVRKLLDDGELKELKGEWYFPQTGSHQFSLRSFGDKNIELWVQYETGRSNIGQLEEFKALRHIFKGAVYLSGGKEYQVENWEPGSPLIILRESNLDYYTYPKMSSVLKSEMQMGQLQKFGLKASLSKIELKTEIEALKKIDFKSGKKVSEWAVYRKLPILNTEALVISFGTGFAQELGLGKNTRGLLESLGELLKKAAVLGLMLEPSDMNVEICKDQNKKTVLSISDVYDGGLGVSKKIFENFDVMINICRNIISSCSCDSGCPFCVGQFEQSGSNISYKQLCLELISES